MTATHARWRILPVHLVAKLFGVLIKVEGMPFGSNRTHLANPPRPEDITGGQVGYQFGACASNAPPPDRDRDALVMLPTQVITNSCATGMLDPRAAADVAAKALSVGLDAFATWPRPVTSTGVGARIDEAAESAKSLDLASAMRREAAVEGLAPRDEDAHMRNGRGNTKPL